MRKPEILAFTYAFPPMAFPRSIQVSRLIANLNASVVVICGEDLHERRDETIMPYIEEHLGNIIRVPFYQPRLLRSIKDRANRYHLSWLNLPDAQRPWVVSAGKRFLEWQEGFGFRPDLVLTFGMPMSDHLFGLEYKRRTGIPWIAHFSDPWVDNPFRRDNPLTAWLNRRMERQVIGEADAVIFTSPETIDLVMRKYPANWRDKAFYVPHCYDRTLFDADLKPPAGRYVVRFIGNFYGHRSPRPLFKALECIARENPLLLEGVSFEFVGSIGGFQSLLDDYPMVRQITGFVGAVSYTESLRLMQTAHCLLVIDAPADTSVFFPSKLVEYIGAGRFIVAISPRGATARIVKEIGGAVADPSDMPAIIAALKKVLERKPEKLPLPADRYDKDVVGKEMMRIIDMVICKGRSSR